METLYQFVAHIFNILVPRFISEEYAANKIPGSDNEVYLLCLESELKEGDLYDCYVRSTYLIILGFPFVIKCERSELD